MADGTHIEWADATWNPVTGCSVLSAGCTNCYAMRMAGTRLRDHDSRKGLTVDSKAGPVWNGQVRFNEQWLTEPLRWKRPRRIFVVAHGDLFHEAVPDAWIDRVFAVMALAPRHQFQVLTKRAARMRAYIGRRGASPSLPSHEIMAAMDGICRDKWPDLRWPLPNVWLGVSVEDQRAADERIPELLATPAAVRWISAEPLLGPVDLGKIVLRADGQLPTALSNSLGDYVQPLTGNFRDSPMLDWVVAGGESGPGARPMHPDWVRGLLDQCEMAGVPFLFKQWGQWANAAQSSLAALGDRPCAFAGWNGSRFEVFEPNALHASDEAEWETDQAFYRVGKKAAGRLLDGVQHDGFPG
jgi:protein gp37